MRRGFAERGGYWCSEENLRWFLASVARRCGYGLVLSLQLGEPLTLSKKEIERGCQDLPKNLVQGRHVVDLAAYRGTTLVVGVVLSRMLVRCSARGSEATELLVKSVVSPPSECIEAFESGGRFLGLSSMQACLVYKLGRSLPLHGRVRRFLERVERVVLLLLLLGGGEVAAKAVDSLERAAEAVSRGGVEAVPSLYTLRPVDWEEGPPRLVRLERFAGEEVFSCGTYSWAEIMGIHFLGCNRCPYISACLRLWR